MPTRDQDFEHRTYEVVAAIPPGFVTTYGDVARAAGHPRRARHVGKALASPATPADLPWHRVVNAAGRISLPEGSRAARTQARRLRDEGVPVRGGKIQGFADLRFYPG